MKISLFSAVCLIVAALTNVGCGGGSGSTGGSTKLYPISTKLRALQPGDRWSWAYSETTNVTSGGVSVDAPTTSAGTQFAVTNSAVLNGQSYLVQTIGVSGYPSPNFNGTGMTSQPEYDYTQDAGSGSLYRTGMYSSFLAAPVLYLPGTWYAGYSNSASSTFSYGVTYSVTFTVEDQEQVTVPAGRFMAWKTSVVETTTGPVLTSGTNTTTGTYWFAPQIGSFVKASTQVVSTDDIGAGTTYTTNFDLQLSSTNTL